MTNEETIERLKSFRVEDKVTGIFRFMDNKAVDEGMEMLDNCVSALEKQIPKKPIHDSFYYHCPICNGIVYKGRGCANNECRQAIDWSSND